MSDTRFVRMGSELPATVDGFAEGDLFVIPAVAYEAQVSVGAWMEAGALECEAEMWRDGIGDFQVLGDAVQLTEYNAMEKHGPSVFLGVFTVEQGSQMEARVLDSPDPTPGGDGKDAVFAIYNCIAGGAHYEVDLLRRGHGFSFPQVITFSGDLLGGDAIFNRLLIVVNSTVNPSV